MDSISPFQFGQVVNKKYFTDRETESKILKDNILAANNTILISPRRFGKSSLVKQVLDGLQPNKDYVTVRLDLTTSRTENSFLENFGQKIIEANSDRTSRWIKKISENLKYIIPMVSYGTGGPGETVSLSFNWVDRRKTREEILKLPQLMAEQTGKKQIVSIDEFQNIQKYQGSLDFQSELRAHWQHHNHVAYVLFGSKRHMMESIFSDRSAPFYNFGQVMKIGKIAEKHWVPFLTKKFSATAKKISSQYAKVICRWMNQHPESIQFCAHMIWSDASGQITDQHMVQGLTRFLNATQIHFLDIFDDLSNIQINLIKAILSGEEKLTSKATIEKYELGTSAGAIKARTSLRNGDIIENVSEGNYQLINPSFELWFRKKVTQEDVIEKCRQDLFVS